MGWRNFSSNQFVGKLFPFIITSKAIGCMSSLNYSSSLQEIRLPVIFLGESEGYLGIVHEFA